MAFHGCAQAVLPGGTRGAHGREDPAAASVQLLVARPCSAERELLDSVAAERRMRVTVDEAGDRAAAGRVELVHLAVERRQVAHPSHRLDRLAPAEDVGVLDHLDLAERSAAQRRRATRGRRELREVADEQTRLAHASAGAAGIQRPPASAASIASG